MVFGSKSKFRDSDFMVPKRKIVSNHDFDPKTMKKLFFQNLFGEVIKTIDTDQETEGLLSRPNSGPHTSKKLGQADVVFDSNPGRNH